MDKYLWGVFVSIAAAASGSILYITGKDIYKSKISKDEVITKLPVTDIKQHINTGTFIGLSIGLSYLYTSKPLLHNLFLKNTKMLKNE